MPQVRIARPNHYPTRNFLAMLILAIHVIPGCGESLQPGVLNLLDPVEAGKTIRVEYTRSKDDPFGASDTLFLTVMSVTPDRMRCARYLPEYSNKDKLRFSFTIPAGTEYIHCTLCPREQPLQSRELAALVTLKDEPVRGAIRHAILNAKSHNEALDAFKEDERRYPEDPMRIPALWYGEFRSGMPKLSYISSDSPHSIHIDLPDRVSLSSADNIALQALAAFYTNDSESVLANLKSLSSVGSGLQHPVVAEALRQIWVGCYGPHTVPLSDSHRTLIVRQIFDIIPKGVNNLALHTTIARELERFADPEDNLRIDRFVSTVSDMLDTIKIPELLVRIEHIRHIMKYYDDRNRPFDVIRVFEKNKAAISRSLLWISQPEDPWVSVMPNYGVESYATFLYGKALYRTENKTKAWPVLHSLVNRATRPDNTFAICQALEVLGKISQDDSNLSEFDQLQHRFADCQCPQIAGGVFSNTKGLHGTESTPSRSTSGYRVPLAWVQTDAGRIALNALDGIPRLLLVTSRTCGVCDIQLPAIARACRLWNTQVQVLLVQTEGNSSTAMIRPHLSPCIPVINHNDVLQAFNVRGVPDVRLILNGQVILEGVADSSSFARVTKTLQ